MEAQRTRACEDCWRKPIEGSCLNSSAWPVLHLITEGTASEGAEHCRLAQVQHFMTGSNRFVLLIEPRAASARPKKSLVADWMNAHQDLVKKHCVGVGIVVSNSFVRILIAGVLLLLRRSVEYATFKNAEEAHAWARGQITKTVTLQRR